MKAKRMAVVSAVGSLLACVETIGSEQAQAYSATYQYTNPCTLLRDTVTEIGTPYQHRWCPVTFGRFEARHDWFHSDGGRPYEYTHFSNYYDCQDPNDRLVIPPVTRALKCPP
jgi:hypothetical protein